jgi:serine/threonine-protein kinase SRPK3
MVLFAEPKYIYSKSANLLGRDHKYVSLKVIINTVHDNHELKVYQHLKSHAPLLGPLYIRPLETSFKIQGPYGSHDVFVQMPLAIAMADFQHKAPREVFTPLIVKEALKQVIPSLHFLHSSAHVIHTGKSSLHL